MLFKLVDTKGDEAGLKINCDEDTLKLLLKSFMSKEELAHTPRRFYEWLLVATKYDIEFLDNPVYIGGFE